VWVSDARAGRPERKEEQTNLEVARVGCKVGLELGRVENLSLELCAPKLANARLGHGAQCVLDSVAERLDILEVKEQRGRLAALFV
jgi:hypothetical protein